ncbi:MAG: hypothetical protein OEL83_20815 [Desulforhopalus sp.]|nr:hypothetical protein [Desulforhopalus sp.]
MINKKGLYSNIKVVFLTIVCSLAFTWASLAYSEDQSNDTMSSATNEFRAAIMEIDLDNNMMVIAEKSVILPFTLQDNTKIWDTEFLDGTGQRMSVNLFKKGDRVLVEGKEISSESIRASKIKLLSRKKAKNLSADESEQEDLPTLQGGVWKN